MSEVDELFYGFISEVEHCGEASQWMVDELKSALAKLIKAEMGHREKDLISDYNQGLYIQLQLDREAVDRLFGIEKPQGGEVGE